MHHILDTLRAENDRLNRKEKSRQKVLERKMLTEMGKGGAEKTKASYRERLVNEINHYGEARGFRLETLTLRDGDGCQLKVKAEKPRTYAELNPGERRRVENASSWKDKNRVPDKVYTALNKIGQFPAPSHVEAHEKELNKECSQIHVVSDQYSFLVADRLYTYTPCGGPFIYFE